MYKKIIKLFSIMLALTVILCGCGENKKKIKMGTAGEGGVYYAFGNSLAGVKVLSGDYSISVRETAGSAANIRLISEGYIDMGIAQADLLDDAYNQKGEFKGKSYGGYKAVAGLYMEACQIVVRKDSGIETIDDLQGKKISIGENESGTERNARQILQAYGLNESLTDMLNMDYKKAADELEKGSIDAMFCTAGVKTQIIEEIAEKCEIKLLDIDENSMSKLTSQYNFFNEYDIPAGTYSGQEKAVSTVGVQSVLIAADSMSEDVVYDITKNLFENSEEIYSKMDGISFDSDMAASMNVIDFHKGALKYFKENNLD